MRHRHPRGGRAGDRRRLGIALSITLGLLAAEVAGGLWSGSLALLADAGHLLADAAALAVSLFAVWMAGRPAPPEKTYGYYRLEILSALFNSVLLIVLAVAVFFSAWTRLPDPPPIDAPVMIGVALLGLAGNAAAIALLLPRARGSLNVRGALLHVVGDAASSLGVVLGAAWIGLTGWTRIDPLLSIGIGVGILVGAWRLLREAVDVLLEATPVGVVPAEVARAIAGVPGVRSVHDLHIWSITSGMMALSGHVVAGSPSAADHDELLNRVKRMLLERYQIEHTTLQIESPDYQEVGDIH